MYFDKAFDRAVELLILLSFKLVTDGWPGIIKFIQWIIKLLSPKIECIVNVIYPPPSTTAPIYDSQPMTVKKLITSYAYLGKCEALAF